MFIWVNFWTKAQWKLCLMACVCFTGVHVGRHSDKPSGDQTESKGLSGKTLSLSTLSVSFRMIHYNFTHLIFIFTLRLIFVSIFRSIFSTWGPRMRSTRGSCAWCAKATNLIALHAVSMPGVPSGQCRHKIFTHTTAVKYNRALL